MLCILYSTYTRSNVSVDRSLVQCEYHHSKSQKQIKFTTKICPTMKYYF